MAVAVPFGPVGRDAAKCARSDVQFEHPANRYRRAEPAVRAVPSTATASPTAAQRTLADPREILKSIGEVVYTWHVGSDAIEWGANVLDVLGMGNPAEIATGATFAEWLAPNSTTSRFDAVMNAAEKDDGQGVRFQVQYGLDRPDDTRTAVRTRCLWVEDTGRWFAGADGRPQWAHGIIRIVKERDDAQVPEQARYDGLTGALNRAGLLEHTTRMMADCQNQRVSFAILLAGIDNLTVLNRSYGYDVADELIAEVVQRVRGQMRSADVIGRYEGNKFAIVLSNCNGEQMERAARRFLEAVGRSAVQTSGGALQAGLRMGGVVAHRQGRSVQALLQQAEEAFYLCSAEGRQRFVAYEPSLMRDNERIRSLAATDEIISALNERRITLAFQPVVYARSGQIAFKEALVRLRRADGRIIAPDLVMPIAERVGLVQLIDYRVLELVIDHLSANPDVHLSLNASITTIRDREFIPRIAAALALHPAVAHRLTIEFTESCAITDIEATAQTVAALKGFGLRVAMDDFGAGFTSFKFLRNLNVDLLKIDGAFIQNLSRSADDRFFVRTLIELARNLAIPTVAEWVEDPESAAILTEWGVTYLQGHQFGKAQLIEDDQQSARDRLAG
jgi:diguanylate cyclase (GGDEF)-like protein